MSRNPMDFPLSPQELGDLKSRLAVEPRDDSTRRALVAWYRRNGHEDQAGRYALAIESLATDDELRAYASMLRGIGADDRRMRELSRLADDIEIEIETRVKQELKAATAAARRNVVGDIAGYSWTAFGLMVVIALIWTFVVTIQGDANARDHALVLSTVALFVLAATCGVTAMASALEKARVTATVFGLLSVAALTFGVLLFP
ncbi:hypothetical protein F6W69_04895 [Microbacterium oxydans]|uniref:hypothetical protein n=1 Tax=Microbacterium TaxID=33882 RepID=UPI0011412A45|nr:MULTISPECIES: hypothetical protein [Microbacterium]KAB1893374.1 hypothetical protein F6W69_04895 [Microbacterium oxydans]